MFRHNGKTDWLALGGLAAGLLFLAAMVLSAHCRHAAYSGYGNANPTSEQSAAQDITSGIKPVTSEATYNHGDNRKGDPQGEPSKWADPNTYFTLLLVVVGFLQVWVLLRQAGSMATQAKTMDTQATIMDSTLAAAAKAAEDQSRDMRESIEAATIAAKAAEHQSDMSRKTQRAFLFIRTISFNINRLPGGMGAYGYPILGKIDTWRIIPVWENSGTTPARHTRVHFNCKCFFGPMPDDFDFPDPSGTPPQQVSIGPKATIHTSGVLLSGDLIGKIATTSHHFYVWGWADYDDVFDGTPRHRTEYCFEVVVYGKPEDGSVEIAFIPHSSFNGADDECYRQPVPYGRTPPP